MTDKPETPTNEVEKLKERILAARQDGVIIFWGLPGELMSAKLDDFVQQPADGILYDLNRLEEISLTYLTDPKWVNDFAVAMTIRKLVEQRATAQQRIAELEREKDIARREALEEAAKVCDEKIAEMLQHRDPAGNVTGVDFWSSEITQIDELTARIRALKDKLDVYLRDAERVLAVGEPCAGGWIPLEKPIVPVKWVCRCGATSPSECKTETADTNAAGSEGRK